jgi:type IV pilus assembly protein PilN
MMDLEKVLPTGVQVTSIEPAISKEGDVTIRLRVSGDRDRAVQLVRNLETSQRFVSPRLSSEQAQTQEGNRSTNVPVTVPGAVQFEILSGYNPLPAKPVKEVSPVKDDSTKDGSTKDGVKKKVTPPRSSSHRGAVVKAPAQKGAPR